MFATRIHRHTAAGAALMLLAGLLGYVDVCLMPMLLSEHVAIRSLASLDTGNVATLLPLFTLFMTIPAGQDRSSLLAGMVARAGAARAQLAGCALVAFCVAAAAGTLGPGRSNAADPVAVAGYLMLATFIAWRVTEACLQAEVLNIAHDDAAWATQQRRIHSFRARTATSMRRGVGTLGGLAVLFTVAPLGLQLATAGGGSTFDLLVSASTLVGLNALVAGFVLAMLMIDVLARIYDARGMRVLFAAIAAAVPTAVLINSLRLAGHDGPRTIAAVAYALLLLSPWVHMTCRWRRVPTGHRQCPPVRSLAIQIACAHATTVGAARQRTRDELRRAATCE